MSELNFNVAGVPNDDRPFLVADNPLGGTIVNTGRFQPGRFILEVPPALQPAIDGAGWFYYDKGRRRFRIIVPPADPPDQQWEAGMPPCLPPEYLGDASKVALIYTPDVVKLPRLVRRGRFFALETGERFTAIDITEFAYLQNLLYVPGGGASLDPVDDQREEVGFNMGRVLGTCAQMFRLFPQEWGASYFDAIEQTADRFAKRGRYLNFVVNADYQLVKYDPLLLWNQVGEIAQSKSNMIMSFVNEVDQAVNRIDEEILDQVKGIPGVLCSRGSNGYSVDSGPAPHLDWTENHINGGEWWRKSHNTAEVSWRTGKPAMTTETARAADRDNDPNHHEDDGKVAAMLCAGKTYHSAGARYSKVLEGGELECARASVRGSKSVPLEFQDGRYDRMPPGDLLRLYRSTLGDGRFHETPVRF